MPAHWIFSQVIHFLVFFYHFECIGCFSSPCNVLEEIALQPLSKQNISIFAEAMGFRQGCEFFIGPSFRQGFLFLL